MRTSITTLLFLALAAACGGKSAADLQKEARAALDAGDAARAIEVVEEALGQDAVRHDAPAAWRLEQIRLDALAASGKGALIKSSLDRLGATYPTQANAALYRALADRVKGADVPGAIEILTAGDQRFPADHKSFAEAIDALKANAALPPDQVEKLKALGYL